MFFSWSRFLKSKLFKSRLGHVKICIKTIWINSDNRYFLWQLRLIEIIKILSRFIEIFGHYQDFFEGLKVQKSWEILIKKNNKTNSLSIKIETNRQDWPKMSCLEGFLNLDQNFWEWKVVSWQNWDFSILIETFRLSRSNFWKCQDFLDHWDKLFESVEIETLDQDTIKTNWDPQP